MHTATHVELPSMVRPRQLAEHLGIARGTVYAWVRRGLLPPPMRVGNGYSAWRREDIEALLEQRQLEARGEG